MTDKVLLIKIRHLYDSIFSQIEVKIFKVYISFLTGIFTNLFLINFYVNILRKGEEHGSRKDKCDAHS